MQAKEFVLGKDKIPSWFNEQCIKGKARINYNDDGKIESVTVHTPTKTVIAKNGDSIFLIKSGLQVVPYDKAKVYKIHRKSENVKNMEQDQGEME